MAEADPSDRRLLELERGLAELQEDLRVLRSLVETDHASALNKIRYVTEKLLHALAQKHAVSWGQGEPTLERMIGPLVASGVLPKNVAIYVRTVQTNASPGSHFQEHALGTAHVRLAQSALLEFLDWYARSTGRESSLHPAPQSPQPRSGGGHRARVLAGAMIVALAGGVASMVWPRDSAQAPAPSELRAPELGLRQIGQLHDDPDAESQGSAEAWLAAAEDFENAVRDPRAPARWIAAHHVARAVASMISETGVALAESELAIDRDPTWAVPQAIRAEALTRAGRSQEALESARRAQRLEPDWWVPSVLAGRAYAASGDSVEAVSELRRALDQSGGDAGVRGELALALLASQLDDEARRMAEEAVAANSAVAPAQLALAELALQSDHPEGAVPYAERCVALAPHSEIAWITYGDSLAVSGRDDEARSAYRRAFRLGADPQLQGAPASRVRAAHAFLDQGDATQTVGAASERVATDGQAEDRLLALHEAPRAHVRDSPEASAQAIASPRRAPEPMPLLVPTRIGGSMR